MSLRRLVLVSALLAGCSALSSFDGTVLGESFEAEASDVVVDSDKTVTILMNDVAGRCTHEEWASEEEGSLLHIVLWRVGPSGEELPVIPGDYEIGRKSEPGRTVQGAFAMFFHYDKTEEYEYMPPGSGLSDTTATGGMVTLGAFDEDARTAGGYLSVRFDDGELKGSFAVNSCSPASQEPEKNEPERADSWPIQAFHVERLSQPGDQIRANALNWAAEDDAALQGFEIERLGASGFADRTTYERGVRQAMDHQPPAEVSTYRIRAVLSSGPRAWVEASAQ